MSLELVHRLKVSGRMDADTVLVLRRVAVGCIEVNSQAVQKADTVYGTAQRHRPNTREHGRVDFKMAMALRHMRTEVKTTIN